MGREGHHIDEVTDLAVAAMQPTINGDLQVDIRIFALQPLHDSYRRIGSVGNAEDDLERWVLLIAKRAQTGVGFRLRAAQWF